MKKICSARELRRAIEAGHSEFRLLIAGGVIYSKKSIRLLRDDRFEVVNHIDDSVQSLSARELHSKTNIGIGMQQGTFVCPSLK